MQALLKASQTVEKLYSNALKAFIKRNWQWAETLVTAALVINPDNKDCLLLKANILWCTDRDAQACEYYQAYIWGRDNKTGRWT